MKRFSLILLFLVLMALLSIHRIRDIALTNILALKTQQTIINPHETNKKIGISTDFCRAQWLSGVRYDAVGEVEKRNVSWVVAAICDPNYIVLMHRLALEDRSLALLIVENVPSSAEAWFWLGDLTPEDSVEHYQRGLSLNPLDARRWMTLAGLIEVDNPQAALDALVRACKLGDPGENACLGAGNRYLAQGDTLSAIQIMREATWQGTLDRADHLQQELDGTR